MGVGAYTDMCMRLLETIRYERLCTCMTVTSLVPRRSSLGGEDCDLLFLCRTSDAGVSCARYHAGLTNHERRETHHRFLRDEVQVSDE